MKTTISSLLILVAFGFLTVGSASALAETVDFAGVRSRAARGESQAQWELGRRYEHGIGVAQSSRRAVQWYRKAAEQNLPKAQYSLGRLFADGDGVRQNSTQALHWFRWAAARDYAPAQNRLGVMHERGQGVAPNPVEAFKWFTLAAANSQAGPAPANLRALAVRLTPEAIAEGERRAAGHVPQNTNLAAVK